MISIHHLTCSIALELCSVMHLLLSSQYEQREPKSLRLQIDLPFPRLDLIQSLGMTSEHLLI